MTLDLPPWHYAHTWPVHHTHKTPKEITEIGTQYIRAKGGPGSEELALELLRAFHPYIAKYVDMIVRGHLPRYGGVVNEDAQKLLTFLMPKGEPVNRMTLVKAC